MEAGLYLNPFKINVEEQNINSQNNNMEKNILFADNNFDLETISNFSIALMGIPDNLGYPEIGVYKTSDSIRQNLLSLAGIFSEKKIIDLGNLKNGEVFEDTFFALSEIFSLLLKHNIPLILLGGSKNISKAIYMSYSELCRTINICSADSRIDTLIDGDTNTSSNFLQSILSNKKNYLFNYTNIGYQNHYVNQSDIDFLNKLNFSSFRLGQIRANIKEAEPEIRDSDFLSFDISCIRQADAPGNLFPGPSGFLGEEACQISKYGGMSDRLTCFALFGLKPETDQNQQTIKLCAQIAWYFINGFSLRKQDYPKTTIKHYKKFIVELSQIKQTLVFYKSPKSDRWWLEVPSESGNNSGVIVACSYEDYQKACNQEVPDRWLKAYQKIN